MRRAWALLLAVVLWAPALLTAPTADAAEAGAVHLALNPRGVARNASTDPTHFVYTVNVYSLTDGARAGTLTDDITCSTASVPCLVFDILSTFRLRDGDITSHAQWSGMPDPQRPGFLLAATRSSRTTISTATGRFAGRTGWVNGWGSVDARGFPAELTYDMFPVIRLGAPGEDHGDRVLGAADVLAPRRTDASPQRAIAQFFTSNGVNESRDASAFVATTDLFSLANGKRIGTALDSVACAIDAPVPCSVLDVTTVFRYLAGELTVRSRISLVPDPQRPGFFLLGTRPVSNTVTRGTGVFAGRTGRLLLSGSVDLRAFPHAAPFEGISLLTFD
jgi:hypothetical protein